MVGHPTLPSRLSAILYYSTVRERGTERGWKIAAYQQFLSYPIGIKTLWCVTKQTITYSFTLIHTLNIT